MLTITNATVTREHVWGAFQRTHDVRLRERYHSILLLMDGKSCPEAAQWLYRDEETIRTWGTCVQRRGALRAGTCADPRTPHVTDHGATHPG